MKIDTFDHKALMGPPKIPGLPDSVQMAPSVDAKKSKKKKKPAAPLLMSSLPSNQQTSSSMAVKPFELESHTEQVDASGSADPAKKLRNLRKKVRDIESLEKKLADGTLTNPEPEQLEKVARKPVMLDEIAELEAAVAKMSTFAS